MADAGQAPVAGRTPPFACAALAPAQAQPGARVALVVGVGAYRGSPPLAPPPNDARAVAETLRRIGLQTDLVMDPDRLDMEQAVRRLGQRAQGAGRALLACRAMAQRQGLVGS